MPLRRYESTRPETEDSRLIADLWDFIENVGDDDPDRTDKFYALRARVRQYWHGPRGELMRLVDDLTPAARREVVADNRAHAAETDMGRRR